MLDSVVGGAGVLVIAYSNACIGDLPGDVEEREGDIDFGKQELCTNALGLCESPAGRPGDVFEAEYAIMHGTLSRAGRRALVRTCQG